MTKEQLRLSSAETKYEQALAEKEAARVKLEAAWRELNDAHLAVLVREARDAELKKAPAPEGWNPDDSTVNQLAP